MLQTQKVVFPKIQSLIAVKENVPIEIEHNFSLRIEFDETGELCLATFEVSAICNAHPDWFSVTVQTLGIFSCEIPPFDIDEKEARAEAYDVLFPYMQSIIADLTTKAGMPPLMLKKINLIFPASETPQTK